MTDRTWHRVAGPDDLASGGVMMAKAGDKLVAVVRIGDTVSALDNACPHMGGPLGQGTVDDGRLVCPWHARAYDVTSGECDGYAEHVQCYAAELRDDGIYVSTD